MRLAALRARATRALGHAVRRIRKIRQTVGPARARLVYHEGYRMPDNGIADVRRAEKIIGHLLAEGWLPKRDAVVIPNPITVAQLLGVHDVDYLESLDDPQTVGRILGGTIAPHEEARQLIQAQRWATAGTVHAARLALRKAHGRRVMVNLGGGFHHAYPAQGQGFCAFNDVAVAITELRRRGFTRRILVIDLDLHHGNGTRGCFANDETVFTFSMHAAPWDESPATGTLDVELGPAVGNQTYLEALGRALPEAFARARPELCFYVAGVDVSADDRLGSYLLTPDAVLERDQMVFHHIGDRPSVMVLAGGYGPDAWRYTARTLVWLLGGVDQEIPGAVERAMLQFRDVAHTLGRSDLTHDDGVPEEDAFRITEADIYGDLVQKNPPTRLLGFYTLYGVELALERYGLFAHVRKRGYTRPFTVMDPSAASGQSITVYGDSSRKEVLLELVLNEITDHPPLRLLFVEWLLLQDPRRKPTPDRPLLPGQQHPGLGCLPIVVGMLAMACERLGMDGLAFVPAHYHVAAQARGQLRFVDPVDHARFEALHEVLGSRRLDEATRLVDQGRVVDRATGEAIRWKPALMALPQSRTFLAQVESRDFGRAIEEAARGFQLEVRER